MGYNWDMSTHATPFYDFLLTLGFQEERARAIVARAAVPGNSIADPVETRFYHHFLEIGVGENKARNFAAVMADVFAREGENDADAERFIADRRREAENKKHERFVRNTEFGFMAVTAVCLVVAAAFLVHAFVVTGVLGGL